MITHRKKGVVLKFEVMIEYKESDAFVHIIESYYVLED